LTTGPLPQLASPTQAGTHLAAVAAAIAGHGLSTRLYRIGDIPVLTIEDPASGSDPTTISISPDLTNPGLPLECTCLWTPALGVTPQAITDTIIAILNAVRPLAAPNHTRDQDTHPR
jgi:hypothetical protein